MSNIVIVEVLETAMTVDVDDGESTVVVVEAEPEVQIISEVIEGPPGPPGAAGGPGPQGPPGAATNGAYRHVQGPAAVEWIIPHNLGFRPGGVLVTDSAGDTIEGDVEHIDANTVRLTFSAPVAGEANLS